MKADIKPGFMFTAMKKTYLVISEDRTFNVSGHWLVLCSDCVLFRSVDVWINLACDGAWGR